ncbi:histone deacetylase family protein [Paraglaciecola sp. 20A4]|uniref:histone deacetylase family protein n=1 Tax=Paraglaciecola sp. 20A4 TaxID=2687288 RepID=UPI0014077F06|nr:histone deacetylase family protein [Paraglaciecola sp. 20A4]|tara:strand:+ start:7131 stop:8048 length:918 start_codon:yes stop_codon:yes gene_type:complete
MSFVFISHPSCGLHDAGEDHPESPDRLHAINDQLIASRLDFVIDKQQAIQATKAQLYLAHDKAYVDHVFASAPKEGVIEFAPDTQMTPRSLDAALYAAGANVMAVDLVMQGKAEQAFCAVRPPGHHAEYAKSMGFCFFNNVAVAAAYAMAQYGLERIAIIDFDVHHGNGTENIFFNDERVLFCSSFESPFFPYNMGPGNEHILNLPLSAGTYGDEFMQAISEQWLPKIDAFAPQLILISAGFDSHYEDDMGHLNLVETDYYWLTSELKKLAVKHCKGRMVSTLEGGYVLSALGRSVIAHIKGMME